MPAKLTFLFLLPLDLWLDLPTREIFKAGGGGGETTLVDVVRSDPELRKAERETHEVIFLICHQKATINFVGQYLTL